ncbi:MAG: hypothetical protein M1831_002735 [Alyxoria varia]|nr:MAG: hypothetical protein M1831_002735 [Alyxoria varia]
MDSNKEASGPQLALHQQSHPSLLRGSRFRIIAAITTMLGLLYFFFPLPDAQNSEPMPWLPSGAYQTKVPLEAHIMSKCPDAQVCLRDLILPTMQKAHDKVDFKISYVGSIEDKSDDVECKHGPDECLGNIIQLCAAQLYPNPKLSLGFTMCMINDLKHVPEKSLVESCALEHGLAFDKLNDCASKDEGAYGLDLLRQSVARTAQANVTKSCTVRLNDNIRCIRDGGKWKDCDAGDTPKDLIRDIDDASGAE